MTSRCHFLIEIEKERVRQDEKWGEQNHSDLKMYAILGEEFGEVGKAILEDTDLKNELIQVASVCMMWLEAIERRIR